MRKCSKCQGWQKGIRHGELPSKCLHCEPEKQAEAEKMLQKARKKK